MSIRRHSRSLRSAFALVAFLCASAAFAQPTAATAPAATQPVAAQVEEPGLFDADAYLAHIKYLAGDELNGRLPGSPGGKAATEYIAKHFARAGLKPAGVDGTYYQPFDIRNLMELREDEAKLEITGLDNHWQLGTDWTPMPFSDPGDISGQLAFVGYGISAEKFDYDDYADFDATDKILLILRNEPKAEDEDAEFGGKRSSRHAYFATKARVAKRNGAKAIVIVNPPNHKPEDDELYAWESWNTRNTYGIPMIHVTRDVANAILAEAEMPDLAALQKRLDQERKPLSTDLVNISVAINTGVERAVGRNVLGLLVGAERPDEYIVVGGHHDHVGCVPIGRGGYGEPEIHNGADDNASGSSGVIELARVFAQGPRPARSIIFMTFDGEERGLLGSDHFVKHPTVPLKQIKGMINLDMIGRYKLDTFTVFGADTGEEFYDLIERHALRLDMDYNAPPSSGFGNSDHSVFSNAGVPAFFTFTGLHPDYHTPADDWELIDAPGATKVLTFVHGMLTDLANMEHGPTCTDGDEADAERVAVADQSPEPAGMAKDQDAAAKDAAPTGRRAGGASRPKVRLGIMPNHIDKRPGLTVRRVLKGQAADQAGLRDGDRITRIGESEITNIRSYFRAVQDFEPGDEAALTVDRNGQELTLTIQFGGEVAKSDTPPAEKPAAAAAKP